MMPLEALENISDEELIKAVSTDEEAFYILMQRYEARLLRYIKRIAGGNQENAEDILQESFIKAYRYLNSFDSSLKFSSWIYRIAHNEAISFWRRHKLDSNISIDQTDNGLINVLAGGQDSDSNAINQERYLKIKESLKMLPPDYREILILRFLEEKNYDEIADIMQRPIGTVSAMIHRAKAKFKAVGLKTKLDELL